MTPGGTSSALATLLRWEDSGGTWAVLSRSDTLSLALCTCTGGEEVERLVTAEPDVVAHVGDRERSDDAGRTGR